MRKKSVKNKQGLTLIEVIVAFAAATIVFLAASAIMVFGQKSLNRGWEQANLQRDASYAMLKIKQFTRGATSATLDEDGNGVKISHAAAWIRFWWLPGQKDLLYQLEGEDQKTLLDGVVENAAFSVTANKVTVEFELKQNNSQAQLATTTMMRNFSAGP